jgi:FkbM family methyltransferase
MKMPDVSLFMKRALGKSRRAVTRIPSQDRDILLNKTIIFPFRNLDFLNRGDMKAILSQSYETVLTHYMSRSLKSGDILLDVGGNVGYISAFAASIVGEEGQVHIFEPLQECFQRLEKLREKNKGIKWYLNNCAVGSETEDLVLTVDVNGNSRGASAVLLNRKGIERAVKCIRLDSYWLDSGQPIERIALVKIDVEGYEFSVLKGMEGLLSQDNFRAAIVCEVNPWVATSLSYTLDDIQKYMANFGYRVKSLAAPESSSDLRKLQHLENVLFVRSG